MHKDKKVISGNNNVIYKIQCNNCDIFYVGQTKRKFNTRINEHIKNIKLDSSRYSVITEQYNHNFDWKNVRIMDTESNYNKRFISKTLHITEQLNV